jgi:hypothetical protein
VRNLYLVESGTFPQIRRQSRGVPR